ncbi:MAG: outer membrane lipoprotein-sorting protein [Candidatus Neomarinimicrobiota bacterium]|jgi:outer membrane lipoprotein-sorting protein
MKKIIILLTLILSAFSLYAQDALSLMKTARQRTKIDGMEAISTLVIRDAKGRTRTRKTAMVSRSYPNEVEKRLIRFVEPADVKGMSMLIVDNEFEDDDMWIYIPASRQTRRIVSSEKSKSFMGSEFSNADMAAPNLNDFSYTLLGEEKINSEACWKIEIRPISEEKEDEYGYIRKITWINKKDNMMIKSEYYDFDNELEKVLYIKQYDLMDKKRLSFVVIEMTIENLQSGRSSDMTMDKVLHNPDVPERYFTPSYMEQP